MFTLDRDQRTRIKRVLTTKNECDADLGACIYPLNVCLFSITGLTHADPINPSPA